MEIKFIKSAFVSFAISSIIVQVCQFLITFVFDIIPKIQYQLTNSATYNLFLPLILSIILMTIVWPIIQKKLFITFSEKFNYHFLRGTLFNLASFWGFELVLLISSVASSVYFGTRSLRGTAVEFRSDTLISQVAFYICAFIFYSILMYFSTNNTHKEN